MLKEKWIYIISYNNLTKRKNGKRKWNDTFSSVNLKWKNWGGLKGNYGGSYNPKGAASPTPKNSITVAGENQYAYAYGKKPSGIGTWAFRIGNDNAETDANTAFFVTGKYSEAKKAAIAEASRRGQHRIKVLT